MFLSASSQYRSLMGGSSRGRWAISKIFWPRFLEHPTLFYSPQSGPALTLISRIVWTPRLRSRQLEKRWNRKALVRINVGQRSRGILDAPGLKVRRGKQRKMERKATEKKWGKQRRRRQISAMRRIWGGGKQILTRPARVSSRCLVDFWRGGDNVSLHIGYLDEGVVAKPVFWKVETRRDNREMEILRRKGSFPSPMPTRQRCLKKLG